ncbi:STN domain-containing protein [Fulvivirgaceae bacterium BMA12]|uniref:STN domain-containing protein n=1 Tax=Agaribacillus aureus TaxID=3051825 RepID=A0ABT8L9X1_9BACT|nr:STN domain-containing protein [Fulvivirgaceae bacterium BMA12]
MVALRISLSCLIFFFFAQVDTFGQQLVLKKKLTFQADNERLEDILLTLAEAGGFSFSYNPDLLPVDSLISLNVENSSVKTVLNLLLGKELEYKISGSLLVILKTKYTDDHYDESSITKKNYTIDGYLQNAETGEYIGNTTVYDIGGLRSTTTDLNGYFSLEIPIREQVVALSVASNDFEKSAMVVLNKDQNLNIPVIPSKGILTASQGNNRAGAAMVNKLKVVQFVTSERGLAHSENLDVSNYRFAQASFVPFVGTNLKMSGTVENSLSLNVLAGYNGASKGLEFGGILNINRFYSRGAQVAGIGNVVGTETNGVQVAGIFNTNFGTVKGLQIAGINNLVLDSLKGVQFSGINNVIIGRTEGIQVAGINNLARNDVDGFQVAGVSNVAIRDVNKLQLAGVVNFGVDITGVQAAGVINASYGQVRGMQVAGVINTSKSVLSVQLSGVMNVATDTVFGTQLTSVVNFAKHNKGLQLGLVNIGHSASGTSIGLLNLFLHGYNKLELFTNEILPLNARIKLGNRRFYNTIGLGTKGFKSNNVWGYSYGIGTVIPVGKKQNDLNFDLSVTDLQDDDTWFETLNLNARLGIHYGFRINQRLMVYGGPVWSHLIYDPKNLEESPFLLDLEPYEMYKTSIGGNTVLGWIGFEFGLRLL